MTYNSLDIYREKIKQIHFFITTPESLFHIVMDLAIKGQDRFQFLIKELIYILEGKIIQYKQFFRFRKSINGFNLVKLY